MEEENLIKDRAEQANKMNEWKVHKQNHGKGTVKKDHFMALDSNSTMPPAYSNDQMFSQLLDNLMDEGEFGASSLVADDMYSD